MARTRPRQFTIDFRTHGGVRPGAGRKPALGRRRVSHAPRGDLAPTEPVLVTMKIRADLVNLRTLRRFRLVIAALQKARERLGARINEFSIQSDHVHLVIEIRGRVALSRAMQGLAVRIARKLNRALGRRGKVFADRFHHRALSTPRQVRNALAYVLCNARKHRVAPHARGWLDPFSSARTFDGWTRSCVVGTDEDGARITAPPRTWLLRTGWRRGGLLDPDHVPGQLA